MASRLADATSPYLLQHKDNPVDWWPWGPEAFEEARRRDVPMFLSVGYSTCHWCHVMAHESFEDEGVARLLNEGFVAIKVDREERPDVDDLYMAACQATTGRGGWPLTVFLDHDRRPFFLGTYFPRSSRGPMVGLTELLPQVRHAWQERRDDLYAQGGQILSHIDRLPEAGRLGAGALAACADAIASRYDEAHGGFGAAPKFPSPHNLLYLLRQAERTDNEAWRRMVVHQMQAMASGGIHDHLGGGFHRYSTDPQWLLPHFEKMLYDQAMVAVAATEAWQATGHDVCRAVARSALDYVTGDLRDPTGGFHSAEDADSEGEEGTYYVWTLDEVRDVLGDDAGLFAEAYGVQEDGNFLDEATRRRTGTNILYRRVGDDELAKRFGMPQADVAERLRAARDLLRQRRGRRVRPMRDDKVLCDWNGLAIAALAKAARSFDEPRYLAAARDAAAFMHEAMWSDGRLRHAWRAGTARDESFLSDHAYLLWGLLELYDADQDPGWLSWGVDVATGIQRFRHPTGAHTLAVSTDVPLQRVEGHDGALPSPNAVAAWQMARLSDLTGDPAWAERAQGVVDAFAGEAARHPAAYVGVHLALDWLQGPTSQVLLVGEGLRDAVAGYRPRMVVLTKRPRLDDVAPWTQAMTAPGAYLCEGHTCQRPVSDRTELEGLLAKPGSGG